MSTGRERDREKREGVGRWLLEEKERVKATRRKAGPSSTSSSFSFPPNLQHLVSSYTAEMASSTSLLLPRHVFIPRCRVVRIIPVVHRPSSSSSTPRSSCSPSPSSHRRFSSSAPPRLAPSSSRSSSTSSTASSTAYKPKTLPNKPHPAFARMQREKEAANEAAANRQDILDTKADTWHYYWDVYSSESLFFVVFLLYSKERKEGGEMVGIEGRSPPSSTSRAER